MLSLFAKPLTWDRLWSLINVKKGVIDHGVYLDGEPVYVRHYGVMHPMYHSPTMWSVFRKIRTPVQIDWNSIGAGKSMVQPIDDGLMRDLVEFGNLWYDDDTEGIEVQYTSNGT